MSRCMKWQVGGWMDEQVDGWVEGWSVDVERIKNICKRMAIQGILLDGGEWRTKRPSVITQKDKLSGP